MSDLNTYDDLDESAGDIENGASNAAHGARDIYDAANKHNSSDDDSSGDDLESSPGEDSPDEGIRPPESDYGGDNPGLGDKPDFNDNSGDTKDGVDNPNNTDNDAYNNPQQNSQNNNSATDGQKDVGGDKAGLNNADSKGNNSPNTTKSDAQSGSDAGKDLAEAADKAGEAGGKVAEAGGKGGEAAADAGVAATGAGAAVVAAKAAAKAAVGAFTKVSGAVLDSVGSGGEAVGGKFTTLVIILGVWFMCCTANQEKLVPGSVEEHHEKEFALDEDYMDDTATGIRTNDFAEDKEFDSYYNDSFLKNGYSAYINGIDGEASLKNGIEANKYNEFADDNKSELDAVTGEEMVIPGVGDYIDCLEINTQNRMNLERADTDSYSMEFTLSKASDYNIIMNRILNMNAQADSTNAGAANQLYTVQKNGESYYVGALVDGFASPGGAYRVTLNNGTSFNMVAVDVKSRSDKQGTGGNGQVDTSFGHGYITSGGKVQMNICEFIDANTSSNSISHSSALNYDNAPMTKGTYVTSVVSLGAF